MENSSENLRISITLQTDKRDEWVVGRWVGGVALAGLLWRCFGFREIPFNRSGFVYSLYVKGHIGTKKDRAGSRVATRPRLAYFFPSFFLIDGWNTCTSGKDKKMTFRESR